MQTNTQTPAAASRNPNANMYGGRCRSCDLWVEPGGGTRTRRGYGPWGVLCSAHSRPIRGATPPAAPPAPSGNAPALPHVSGEALRVTAALVRHAEESGDDRALPVLREIHAAVAAVLALRGDVSNDAPADAPAPADVAADVLADLGLGSRPVTGAPTIVHHADGRIIAADGSVMRGPTVAAPAPVVAPVAARVATPAPRKPAKVDRWAALRKK